jgi:hypothetical protein
MSDRTRIRIAAVVTALFLGGIATVGLTARNDKPDTATATSPSSPAVARPPATPATQAFGSSDGREDRPYEGESGEEQGDSE